MWKGGNIYVVVDSKMVSSRENGNEGIDGENQKKMVNLENIKNMLQILL